MKKQIAVVIVILICIIVIIGAYYGMNTQAPVPSASPSFYSSPSPTITATTSSSSTPVATPMPTVGTVQGQLVGYTTYTPIAGATMFLCPITGANECQVQANNSVISQTDGNFTFVDISPGSYVLICGLAGEFNVTAQSCDGKTVRFVDVDSLLDTFTEEGLILLPNEAEGGIGMHIANSQLGSYYISGGAAVAKDTGLRIEFRDNSPILIEVTAGKTTTTTFTITEDMPDSTP